MSSTDAPTWWADVQQEREDLAGRGRRPADDWLGEDIDFVPRRRLARRDDAHRDVPPAGASHPLHGVFVPAPGHDEEPHAAAPVPAAASVTIELGRTGVRVEDPAADAGVAHELRHLRAADDPFATPPPPVGTRRTVHIKGRPGEARVPSLARRHRPRTASDRVGPRPDRIALWAVALGAILILLAATTSSSHAAVPHRAATPHVATAKVAHATVHAPVGHTRAHR